MSLRQDRLGGFYRLRSIFVTAPGLFALAIVTVTEIGKLVAPTLHRGYYVL